MTYETTPYKLMTYETTPYKTARVMWCRVGVGWSRTAHRRVAVKSSSAVRLTDKFEQIQCVLQTKSNCKTHIRTRIRTQVYSNAHTHTSLGLQVVEDVQCKCPWCAVVCNCMWCAVLYHSTTAFCVAAVHTRAHACSRCSGSDVCISDLNSCLHRMGRDTAMGRERDGCKTRVGVHLVTLVMQLPTLEWAGAYINGWRRREMETGVNDERVLSRRSAQPLFDTCCCTTRTLFLSRFQDTAVFCLVFAIHFTLAYFLC